MIARIIIGLTLLSSSAAWAAIPSSELARIQGRLARSLEKSEITQRDCDRLRNAIALFERENVPLHIVNRWQNKLRELSACIPQPAKQPLSKPDSKSASLPFSSVQSSLAYAWVLYYRLQEKTLPKDEQAQLTKELSDLMNNVRTHLSSLPDSAARKFNTLQLEMLSLLMQPFAPMQRIKNLTAALAALSTLRDALTPEERMQLLNNLKNIELFGSESLCDAIFESVQQFIGKEVTAALITAQKDALRFLKTHPLINAEPRLKVAYDVAAYASEFLELQRERADQGESVSASFVQKSNEYTARVIKFDEALWAASASKDPVLRFHALKRVEWLYKQIMVFYKNITEKMGEESASDAYREIVKALALFVTRCQLFEFEKMLMIFISPRADSQELYNALVSFRKDHPELLENSEKGNDARQEYKKVAAQKGIENANRQILFLMSSLRAVAAENLKKANPEAYEKNIQPALERYTQGRMTLADYDVLEVYVKNVNNAVSDFSFEKLSHAA